MSNRPMFFAAAIGLALVIFLAAGALGQAGYTSQIRGLVTDQSGAIVQNAIVTVTNDATNIATSAKTDERGLYALTGLRPASYTIKVEAPGFRGEQRKDLALGVDQQTSMNFILRPMTVSETVIVTEAVPLLDTDTAALGTDVTNEFMRDIPLYNRSFFGLVFLAGGVTETTGPGTNDSYPSGTNFVSNGQRNSTAEIRLDGSPTTAPEQGEGATTNVYYQPSVEIVQEFKVQNNSFSAEFGNNGGTVVNIVLKQGGNKLHGSGWWYGQRAALDAKDFFNTEEKPDHTRDQYGFALNGPIRKDKTFFFVDYEGVRQKDPVDIVATVPTPEMRLGDFSQSSNIIYNPYDCSLPNPDPDGPPCLRTAFPSNQITGSLIDPVGQALLNLYPQPTDSSVETDNFRTVLLSNSPSRQFDIKLDHQISNNMKIGGRYSYLHSEYTVPLLFGNDEFGDGANYKTDAHNISLEHNWTVRPTILWTSHLSVDRAVAPGFTNFPDPTSVGFPALLNQSNGLTRMPAILTDETWSPLFSACCIDTHFAHTLYTYSSALQWVKGAHSMKFGGEQRLFFNNFWQPNYPTGFFFFGQDVTASAPHGSDGGNSFATMLLGWGGDAGGSGINIVPTVANKSAETSFFFQDGWRVTPRLTLNLGLRYEWSNPYSERKNQIQFSDFNGDSGVDVPGLGRIRGTTIFASPDKRTVPVDRNNFAPRLGFAYQVDNNTVFRGGAGIYYGLNVATNFQYAGTAFRKSAIIQFSQNNGQLARTTATLADPFPNGLTGAQGQKYGPLAVWGYPNQNDLGTQVARNAEIYQWNIGVQHLFPAQLVIAADYSANRSTHLPWGGYSSTRNRNFIPSAIRRQYTTSDLDSPVPNPFYSLFQGPTAIFNEPESSYNNPELSLLNTLRPFPQFDGPFEGLPLLAASSWYHSLQIRFQKRASHYVSFEGNYTFSKSTDYSSAGANAFMGHLDSGNPQELDNLRAEHAISANDATHRLVAAIIVDLPIGRGRWIGTGMNRVLDGIVGGWSLYTVVTRQSGLPLFIGMVNPQIADGNQRPNVVCANPRTGLSSGTAALTVQPFLNKDCFVGPDEQQPGNAPRYFSNLRGDGIHNVDLSLSKEFVPREGMKLQVRAEFFNFTNTPRFAFPDTAWDIDNDHFGIIDSTADGSNPRRMQLGVRFEF
jgi:carboxypeptidase family protein/TonB-dependent receptor-like protein